MSEAISPCPFQHKSLAYHAGFDPPVLRHRIKVPGVFSARVYCACGVSGPEAESRDEKEARQLAAAAWNTRAPSDLVAGMVGAQAFDFLAHLARQAAWSEKTFGPGPRTKGVIDHIRKELLEIEADPTDPFEWSDVVILGLDGFWRSGATPKQIIETIVAKQAKNELRTWPDWRTADPNKAIEHDRSADTPKQGG